MISKKDISILTNGSLEYISVYVYYPDDAKLDLYSDYNFKSRNKNRIR